MNTLTALKIYFSRKCCKYIECATGKDIHHDFFQSNKVAGEVWGVYKDIWDKALGEFKNFMSPPPSSLPPSQP